VTDGWDDDELMARLQQALHRRQSVPVEFMETARNAYAWHDIDAELAQLTYDSGPGRQLAAATRAEDAQIRALTFTSARLTIELEVAPDAVLGQILPMQTAALEVQMRSGEEESQFSTDEIGCFAIRPVPRSPFRLRCRASGGVDVLTGWITL
jgi:hypothetical protein